MNSSTFTLGTGASVVVVAVVVVVIVVVVVVLVVFSCPKQRCDVITVVKRQKVTAVQAIAAVMPENPYTWEFLLHLLVFIM